MSLKDRFDKFIDYLQKTEKKRLTTRLNKRKQLAQPSHLLKNYQHLLSQDQQKMQILPVFMRDSKNWQCKAIVQMRK